MKRREVVMGAILVLATSFAIGCGSKEIAKNNNASTYNKIQNVAPMTKSPTVITSKSQTAKDDNAVEGPKTEMPKTTPAAEKTTACVEKELHNNDNKKEVKNIKSMAEVMTTIALYMSEGENYDPDNEECYYSIMYMLGNNVAEKFGRGQYKDVEDQIYVGKKTMQTLSAAAFSNHSIIDKVSNQYKDMIQYDKDENLYVMSGSDAGDVNGKIKKAVNNGDGSYTVIFDLDTGDGEALGNYEFELVENHLSYLNIGPKFYYRVKSVRKLAE